MNNFSYILIKSIKLLECRIKLYTAEKKSQFNIAKIQVYIAINVDYSVARNTASWSKVIKREFMNFHKILSRNRTYVYSGLHISLGVHKSEKKKRERNIRPSRKSSNSVSTNFPNFANKLSDVKIPRWIVKVLISSDPGMPTCSFLLFAFPEICVHISAQQLSKESRRHAWTVRDKDENGIAKSTLIFYVFTTFMFIL